MVGDQRNKSIERGTSKQNDKSTNSRSRVINTSTNEIPLNVSQTINDPSKLSTQNPKLTTMKKPKVEEPKVHRGPLNVNAVTTKDPKSVLADLVNVMTKLGVNVQKGECFSLECKFKKIKFLVEVNSLERFSNIHVVKFFRKGNENENYMGLCSDIFKKLNL